jgi:hypothetical protein
MTKNVRPLAAGFLMLATVFGAAQAQLGDSAAVPIAPLRGSAVVLSRPINGPITITQSGSYVVTWDISVITPPAITVLAPNVIIDLNGHSVGTPGFNNGDVIVMGTGSRQLKIKNGHLFGGRRYIASTAPAIQLTMDSVTCADGRFGVDLENASSLSIKNSDFSAAGESFHVNGQFTLDFKSNTVRQSVTNALDNRCGVGFGGVTNGIISGNTLSCTAYNGTVLTVNGTGSARIENNTVSGFDTQTCISPGVAATVKDNAIDGCRYAISSLANGNRIIGNQITGMMASGNGILLNGSNNVIADNTLHDFDLAIVLTASGNTVSGNAVLDYLSYGIVVSGSSNVIDGNQIQTHITSSTEGLVFSLYSADNTYKNNDFRGTTGAAVRDDGTNNIDGGGNLQ